jgi:hypothetical protein
MKLQDEIESKLAEGDRIFSQHKLPCRSDKLCCEACDGMPQIASEPLLEFDDSRFSTTQFKEFIEQTWTIHRHSQVQQDSRIPVSGSLLASNDIIPQVMTKKANNAISQKIHNFVHGNENEPHFNIQAIVPSKRTRLTSGHSCVSLTLQTLIHNAAVQKEDKKELTMNPGQSFNGGLSLLSPKRPMLSISKETISLQPQKKGSIAQNPTHSFANCPGGSQKERSIVLRSSLIMRKLEIAADNPEGLTSTLKSPGIRQGKYWPCYVSPKFL